MLDCSIDYQLLNDCFGDFFSRHSAFINIKESLLSKTSIPNGGLIFFFYST